MYRIFRMREQARLSFRVAPHTSGETAVKLKDYSEAGTVEAASTYEAWDLLRATEQPLEVGDVLEAELGGIKICKYIGFDDAKWVLPDPKPGAEAIPVAAGDSTADAAKGKL
jgi:hypothetical protein